MTEFTLLPDDEDGYAHGNPPAYGTPGRIIVEIEWGYDDVNVIDYDADTSVFWLMEGLGADWLVENLLDLPGPGRYLLENVIGRYIHGQDWRQSPDPYDDDEEWSVGRVSRTDLDALP